MDESYFKYQEEVKDKIDGTKCENLLDSFNKEEEDEKRHFLEQIEKKESI